MSTLICKECGAEVVRNSIAQKYCRECASKKRYQSKPKKKTAENVEAPERIRRSYWDLSGKSMEDIALEARALGMSYGKYAAACANCSIINEIISAGMTVEGAKKKIKKAYAERVPLKKRRYRYE